MSIVTYKACFYLSYSQEQFTLLEWTPVFGFYLQINILSMWLRKLLTFLLWKQMLRLLELSY